MPKSYDLAVGIIMAVTGLYVFAVMPMFKKRLAKRQQAGERTAEQVRRELKTTAIIALGFLVFGGCLICQYYFGSHDR